MKKRNRLLAVVLLICLCQGGVCVFCPESSCVKAVEVSDFEGLKRALESSETSEICLERDVVIEKRICISGSKGLDGRGHTLTRKSKDPHSFGGTLLSVEGGELTLEDITVSGGGKSGDISSSLYGRLIDIGQGSVRLKNGAVLCRNQNRNQENDGGGAVLVKSGGKLILEGGCIEKNQNVVGGAAVYVEKGGCFEMRSGTIRQNRTDGIGPIEGFDGRGGAVYVKGRVEISGGMIQKNRAKGYQNKGIVYGGAGGAVFADKSSEVRITGGCIGKNHADVGAELYLQGGICKLGKSPEIESIYLHQGVVITAEKSLGKKVGIELIPENYREGLCLARAASAAPFKLKKKNGFILVYKDNKVYLSEKKDIKKSQEKKSKNKSIGGNKEQEDKERENKRENKRKNDKGQKRNPRAERKKLVMPTLETVSRYLFESEVKGYSEGDWERELLNSCRLHPGDFDKSSIVFQWQWGGVVKNTPGEYRVRVSLTGGDSSEIPVHIVGDHGQEEENYKSYIRFTEPILDKTNTADMEIWYFSPKELKRAKDYMSQRENPFSHETNQSFLSLFQNCRQAGEGEFG